MKTDELLIEELNNHTDEAIKSALEFCEALNAFDNIDVGELKEEDKERYQKFLVEKDRRRAFALKRILVEYGNFAFV